MSPQIDSYDHAVNVCQKVVKEALGLANMVGVGMKDKNYVIDIGFENTESMDKSPYKNGDLIDGLEIRTMVIGTISAL